MPNPFDDFPADSDQGTLDFYQRIVQPLVDNFLDYLRHPMGDQFLSFLRGEILAEDPLSSLREREGNLTEIVFYAPNNPEVRVDGDLPIYLR